MTFIGFKRVAITLGIVLIVPTVPAFSEPTNKQPFKTSFDCPKSTSHTERKICEVRELAEADLEMASIYKSLISSLPSTEKNQLKNEQLDWLNMRNKCDSARNIVGCIKNLYTKRIETLKKQREALDAPFPSATEVQNGRPTDSISMFEFKIHPQLSTYQFKLIWRDDWHVVEKIEVYKSGEKLPFQVLEARMDERPPQGPQAAEYFQAEDINFDGYKDLKLLIMWGATGNLLYDYYVFDPNAGKFVFNKSISDLFNPVPNPVTRELEVLTVGGMNVYTKQRYKYEGQRPILIWEELQDWDRGKKLIIKTVKERRDGEMVTIERQENPSTDRE